MKLKVLAVLVSLAAGGESQAQSSVTLFGVVDAAVAYYQATSRDPLSGASVKQTQWALRNSGLGASRLGFRGTEDLGSGLAASFWLEAPISNDDGGSSLTFERRSTVSLSGSFGEVRLGRDYTPTFWNDVVFDPFETSGAGTSLISQVSDIPTLANFNHFRASNSVGYLLPPDLGGLHGQVMYGFNENTETSSPIPVHNSSAGRYVGGRIGYARGPLNVAAAYGQSNVIDTESLGYKLTTANLGASWDFDVVKVMGELSRVRTDFSFPSVSFPAYHNDYDGWLLGATLPIGPGLIRLAYSEVKYKDGLPSSSGTGPMVRMLALGYVHNLSRRTALYATVALVRNKNNPLFSGDLPMAGIVPSGSPAIGGAVMNLVPESAKGYEFGIRHSF